MATPGDLFIVPGSLALPGTDIILGSPGKEILTSDNLLTGLRLLQEHSGEIRVRIPLPPL